MKKTTNYFAYCYDNDTTVEYVDVEHYSMLNISFTSEDEDAGTETIHSDPAVPSRSVEEIAYEMLQEISKYMDMCDEGKYNEIDRELRMKYSDYMQSTLIATENALQQITKDYHPVIRNKHGNLIKIVTIEEAGAEIKNAFQDGKPVRFDFGAGDMEPIKLRDGMDTDMLNLENYGIRLIDNPFDGYGPMHELIIMCGCYGGGNISTAYYVDDEYEGFDEQDAEAVVEMICNSCGCNRDHKILLETIELKEEK